MSRRVFYIKLLHSFLLFLIIGCTAYVFISAFLDQLNELTWWAFAVVVAELLALLLNDWRCPLTDWAEEHGAEVGSVADLFLPKWVSDRLFIIFGIVFLLTCLLLIWRVFQ